MIEAAVLAPLFRNGSIRIDIILLEETVYVNVIIAIVLATILVPLHNGKIGIDITRCRIDIE